MGSKLEPKIQIITKSNFLLEQSDFEKNFAFSYTVIIKNTGKIAAKLISRHWLITDANGQIKEIHSPGVVGEQPYLLPGKSFSYTSYAILETPVGCMQGSYEMVTHSGDHSQIIIPPFSLAIEHLVH